MSKVCDAVSEKIRPIIEGLGLEIVDVEYKKQYDAMNLTVFIDKKGGVSLDDCEAAHNAIDAPLDELDPTRGEPYVLNVSSPGLDRPLKTQRDFDRKTGEEIEISFYAAQNGEKRVGGVLKAYDGENVSIERDGEIINYSMKNVASIKPLVRF